MPGLSQLKFSTFILNKLTHFLITAALSKSETWLEYKYKSNI